MSAEIIRHEKFVSLSYSLFNGDGIEVEDNGLPVSYIHGRPSEIFPRVIEALQGRTVGDEVTVQLRPEEAFGNHDPNLTFTDDIDNVPPEVRYLGAEIEAQNNHGEIRQFRVTRIENGRITVDANHPLAGEAVTFRVTVTEVRDPTPDESERTPPASEH